MDQAKVLEEKRQKEELARQAALKNVLGADGSLPPIDLNMTMEQIAEYARQARANPLIRIVLAQAQQQAFRVFLSPLTKPDALLGSWHQMQCVLAIQRALADPRKQETVDTSSPTGQA